MKTLLEFLQKTKNVSYDVLDLKELNKKYGRKKCYDKKYFREVERSIVNELNCKSNSNEFWQEFFTRFFAQTMPKLKLTEIVDCKDGYKDASHPFREANCDMTLRINNKLYKLVIVRFFADPSIDLYDLENPDKNILDKILKTNSWDTHLSDFLSSPELIKNFYEYFA